jgi:3-phenylpropionate/trans-cinnamate dioxygenase ferredoxin subunit
MAEWRDVKPVTELPPGEWCTVYVEGVDIAIFNIDGEFYAIENVCTHDSGELTGGTWEGDEIVCPRHGARFSIKTGAVLSPPAYEDVETFAVRVTGEMLQVCLPD